METAPLNNEEIETEPPAGCPNNKEDCPAVGIIHSARGLTAAYRRSAEENGAELEELGKDVIWVVTHQGRMVWIDDGVLAFEWLEDPYVHPRTGLIVREKSTVFCTGTHEHIKHVIREARKKK